MKNKNLFYGMVLVSMSIWFSQWHEFATGPSNVPSLSLDQLRASLIGNIYLLIHTWQIIPFIAGIVIAIKGLRE